MFWMKASMSQGYDSKSSEWKQTEKPMNDMNHDFPTPYSRDVDLEFMNASLNDTADIEIDTFYFYQIEQISVLCVLFLVIVVGNSSILITLSTGKRKKSRMDYFIKQLALADLMVGLISVFTDLIWKITVAWHAGYVACKIIKFMQVVVTYSSTYVLVALSIDRYDAIAKPMNFSRSWWRARILIGLAWGFSLLFATPILFLYEEKSIQGTLQCWIDLDTPVQWQIYMCLVSFTVFVAPAIIIATCYALIVSTIWAQNGTIKNGVSEDLRRASSRGLIPRAKIKTIKMTFGIVFVFVVCWSPYIIFDLLQVFHYIPDTQTNIAVGTFIQSLAPLNSAANPIIYCIFSTSFCTRVRNILGVSWIPGWCSVLRQHCFRHVNAPETTRTTMTSSLTANSSNSRGHLGTLRSTSSKKRVMVSLV